MPKFQNELELEEYLEKLEGRVDNLYRSSRKLPKTNIVSDNFLKRAFAIWGHYFVAHLIIGAITGAIFAGLYLLFAATMLSTIFGRVRTNPPTPNYPSNYLCGGILERPCDPTPTPEP